MESYNIVSRRHYYVWLNISHLGVATQLCSPHPRASECTPCTTNCNVNLHENVELFVGIDSANDHCAVLSTVLLGPRILLSGQSGRRMSSISSKEYFGSCRATVHYLEQLSLSLPLYFVGFDLAYFQFFVGAGEIAAPIK